jgi:hypothetical protein
MNHFPLSNDRFSVEMHFNHTGARRYGTQAVKLLINDNSSSSVMLEV